MKLENQNSETQNWIYKKWNYFLIKSSFDIHTLRLGIKGITTCHLCQLSIRCCSGKFWNLKWNSKLKLETQNSKWNLITSNSETQNLKFKTQNWQLKVKLQTETQNSKLKFETWSETRSSKWNLKLETLKLMCYNKIRKDENKLSTIGLTSYSRSDHNLGEISLKSVVKI